MNIFQEIHKANEIINSHCFQLNQQLERLGFDGGFISTQIGLYIEWEDYVHHRKYSKKVKSQEEINALMMMPKKDLIMLIQINADDTLIKH